MSCVCRFTRQGLLRFRDFLQDARTNSGASMSRANLWDSVAAVPIEGPVTFDPLSGTQRLHAAEYVEKIMVCSGGRELLELDVEFWAWLAAANFDALCLKDRKTGCYEVGMDSSYWIPALHDDRRRARHRLSGPYFAIRAHRSDIASAMGVLGSKLNGYHDLNERVLSKAQFETSHAVNFVVTSLYYSAQTKGIKAGVNGTRAGSARRLVDVLTQFALTYDLGALSGTQLLSMLPREFDRFRG